MEGEWERGGMKGRSEQGGGGGREDDEEGERVGRNWFIISSKFDINSFTCLHRIYYVHTAQKRSSFLIDGSCLFAYNGVCLGGG